MVRAGLKPMQPMQLHWAPRVWGPRAMVFGQVVHFCSKFLQRRTLLSPVTVEAIELIKFSIKNG